VGGGRWMGGSTLLREMSRLWVHTLFITATSYTLGSGGAKTNHSYGI
jgi:hypothetical protein